MSDMSNIIENMSKGDLLDAFRALNKLENKCYDCYDCYSCYDCWDCSNCIYCTECAYCNSCIFCTSIDNKKYHILNQPVTDEVYKVTLAKLNL